MTDTEEKELIKNVRQVFSNLSLIAPFSYPLLMMPVVVMPNLNGLAATNGVTFYINPKTWEPLSFRQKMFVSMHEWLHVVMMHMKRIQGRRIRAYNYAADFAVNDMIMRSMSDQFEPVNGILYDGIDCFNKTAEDIYNSLLRGMDHMKDNNIIPVCNYCRKNFTANDRAAKEGQVKCDACGRANHVHVPAPPFLTKHDAINQLLVSDNGCQNGNDLYQLPSDADADAMIDAIIKAAARAKGMNRGLLPGGYDDYVDKLKKSHIPWERLLLRYAKESLKGSSDRNPFKPDPKYLPFDIFVPTEQDKNVNKLVFIVDTSGSMATEEFEKACGHIQRLGTICNKCVVITADTRVNEVIRVKRIKSELKKKSIKFQGRGGTDMHNAFEVAEKLNPDLIILFSDMDIGDFPKKPKRANVIFLATERSYIDEVPYGVLIKVK